MSLPAQVEQWRDLVTEAVAATPGAPPVDLVLAQMQRESFGDPDAKSGANCIGLLQVAPATAHDMGILDGESLTDPAVNVRIAVKYLVWLSGQVTKHVPVAPFLLHWQVVLACYNGGIGNVLTKFQGLPPFRETMDYVRMVTLFYSNQGGDV